MQIEKAKEWADKVDPVLQKINKKQDISIKMIDIFTQGIILGGEIERKKMEKENAKDDKS